MRLFLRDNRTTATTPALAPLDRPLCPLMPSPPSTPARGTRSASKSPQKKKQKPGTPKKKPPPKNPNKRSHKSPRDTIVMNQRYKNHRLWEELQKKGVLTQPDQVKRLLKFIEDAQGAAQRTGMDLSPHIQALSSKQAEVEEERARLEEERKELEAQRAEYYKKLERYEELVRIVDDNKNLLRDTKEAMEKNAKADTRLRQCTRTLNKIKDMEAATKKVWQEAALEPCLYCEQTIKERGSYRVCWSCHDKSHEFYTVDAATQTGEVEPD